MNDLSLPLITRNVRQLCRNFSILWWSFRRLLTPPNSGIHGRLMCAADATDTTTKMITTDSIHYSEAKMPWPTVTRRTLACCPQLPLAKPRWAQWECTHGLGHVDRTVLRDGWLYYCYTIANTFEIKIFIDWSDNCDSTNERIALFVHIGVMALMDSEAELAHEDLATMRTVQCRIDKRCLLLI